MKILVLGAAGKMGRAVSWYLGKDPQITKVGLLDAQEGTLKAMAKDADKVNIHIVSIEDSVKLQEIMKGYDAGIVVLPNRRLSYLAIEAAIAARLNLVDILEEYHRRPDEYEIEGLVVPAGMSIREYGESLHQRAEKNDVLILDGMGFAPGLSNLTTEHGISLLDKVKTAVARVGGIPNADAACRHPLCYMTTWSIEHVLREYNVKTSMIKDGKVVEVQALSDMECFKFGEFGRNADLECAVTPGMPSFIYTHPELEYFAEKTVRWPGHYSGIRTLIDSGMLSQEQVETKWGKISPREFLLGILNPKLVPLPEDKDACVMYNTVTGEKSGKEAKVEIFMWDEAQNGFTGMQRVTGFPAAIGGKLVAGHKIDLTGVRAPEECVKGENYKSMLDELKLSDIHIMEKITS
ncbi:MAG: saccharopine dehydrogenase C-terminal domain-containing protein [Anaerolineales bacterium]|jgi:saccharopine dehydrogenase-like NADP-dependent oxidoreductase